jgi:hypothetical protein
MIEGVILLAQNDDVLNLRNTQAAFFYFGLGSLAPQRRRQSSQARASELLQKPSAGFQESTAGK